MRRSWLALLAAGAVGAAAPSRSPSWEIALAPKGERGAQLVIEGRVHGVGGHPMRDVLVYVYHADDQGNYTRGGEKKPRLSGMLRTNVLGGYRVRTVIPGMSEGIPHIHFELAAP